MLEVNKRKSDCITGTKRLENGLYLYSEKGLLRLTVQSESIVRVSYTESGSFSEDGKKSYAPGIVSADSRKGENGGAEWSYDEDGSSVFLRLPGLILQIHKETGSITYLDGDGSLLLRERDRESRIVEEFDSYRTVVDENTKVEEVMTPDGIKRAIKEASVVFDQKLYHTWLHLAWQEDERLFGLGQAQEGVLNLRGTTQYLHQSNLKIAIPFLVSTKGYGILLATEGTAIFQDTQYGSYLYTEADVQMDYYFLAGKCMDDTIAGYRYLTGKAVMLPRWCFGFIQSQERYESQKEILDVADQFRSRGFGLDGLVLDWCSWEDGMWGQKSFDPARFPDPSEMIRQLHEKQVHFMISIWPNMNRKTANYEEFLDAQLLLPASDIYDAFQEKARELYWKQARQGLWTHDVDAWWCDSSEPFTPEWAMKAAPDPAQGYSSFVQEAGKYIPAQRMNAYGLAHAQAIYEGQRSSGSDKRVVNLTRSCYTGGQRYGVILWSGDTYASWETLRRQIAAGLNFCASGLPYWTLDIGAFFVKKGGQWFWNGDYDKGLEDPGYRELFVRWFQYGAFLPVFRSHGTDVRREPWLFGEEGEACYDALLEADRRRYRLIPYIYSWAYRVWKEDRTMMRMLAFDFPEDDRALECADEYMFGESILVCPVTEPMYYGRDGEKLPETKETRRVYLPAGCDWYDYYTDERLSGGCYVEAAADLGKIPLFVRAGSIIPAAACDAQSTWKEADAWKHTVSEEQNLEFHIYPGADADFSLYEDSGNGYEYEAGQYRLTGLHWDDERCILESTEGTIVNRVIIHG